MAVTHSGRRDPSKAISVPRQYEPFSVDEPRYLLGQVAFAAGITSSLLKAWITRKVIPMGEHDREAHGKGSARVFTLRRALSVALAAELVNIRISAAAAGQLGTGATNLALRKSRGDVLQIDDLIAIYPVEDGHSFRAASWNSTIKIMLGKNAPEGDVSSFMIVSVKAVAEKVLRRLGELS